MSLQSLNACVNETGLRGRILAAIVKIASDPDPVATHGIPANTRLVGYVKSSTDHAEQALNRIMWSIALSGETAYETAWDPDTNPEPGKDASVFTDTQVINAVINNWPTN